MAPTASTPESIAHGSHAPGSAEGIGIGFSPIRACLFDMDGLLIDSEDIYTLCTNIVLREYGRPDMPWNIKAQLQGRTGPEAGDILHAWAQLPISRAEYMEKQKQLQRQYFPSTKPLPGALELIHTLTHKTSPLVHIALATSSNTANFKAKTAHLGDLFTHFPADQVVVGDDPRIPPGKGKPAPDIYLLALQTINDGIRRDGSGGGPPIRPDECLVFEDSVTGVEAARRAGMRVVWVPHPELLKVYRGQEQLVLAGLGNSIHFPGQGTATEHNIQAGFEESSTQLRDPNAALPPFSDAGWAEMLCSLEDLSYQRYGINLKS